MRAQPRILSITSMAPPGAAGLCAILHQSCIREECSHSSFGYLTRISNAYSPIEQLAGRYRDHLILDLSSVSYFSWALANDKSKNLSIVPSIQVISRIPENHCIQILYTKVVESPGYAIRVHYGRALVRALYLYGFKAIYAFKGRQSLYCVIHLCIT